MKINTPFAYKIATKSLQLQPQILCVDYNGDWTIRDSSQFRNFMHTSYPKKQAYTQQNSSTWLVGSRQHKQ